MRPFKITKNYRYFESQEESEQVVLITRKHWLTLIMPFIFVGGVVILLTYFFGTAIDKGEAITGAIEESAKNAFLTLVALYGILVAFGTWLMRYLNVIILTDKHLVDVSQKAFFSRSVSALALANIEDVSIDKNGFLGTVLDYGNIKIQTAGEMPNFELKSIADPETVQRTIMETKENFKG